MKFRSEKGQIAVFFAVGFVFFVTLLSLIINSSVMVYQKTKLQNTLDLAVKAASQVQASHLNQIIQYNKAIERNLILLSTNIVNPALYPPCGAYAFCWVCRSGRCPGIDDAYRTAMVATYSEEQARLVSSINNEIKETNKKAYDAALRIILNSRNIPGELAFYLKKSLGYVPDAETLIGIYESQRFDFQNKGEMKTLSEIYYFENTVKDGILFEPEGSIRPVAYTDWKYRQCGEPIMDEGPCFEGPKFEFPPKFKVVGYQINKKDNSLLPFFHAWLTYKPINDFNIFSIFRKTLEGELAEDKLFRQREKLIASSMARPIGGNINDEDFYNDAELVGIADRSKINFDIPDKKYFLH